MLTDGDRLGGGQRSSCEVTEWVPDIRLRYAAADSGMTRWIWLLQIANGDDQRPSSMPPSSRKPIAAKRNEAVRNPFRDLA
jgi:hypothetical protein